MMNQFWTTTILALVLVGCASSRKQGWETSSTKASSTSINQQAEFKAAMKLWKNRHKRADLVKCLDKLKKIHAADPSNYTVLMYLTRGHYFLADVHEAEVDRKKSVWEEGATWGERAMATNKAFAKAVRAGEKVEDALKYLTKKEIGAVYWSAANLGKWAKNTGIVTTLKYKNRIRNMVKRVEEWDEKFFYSAPHRYWGAYYSIAPSFAGGDMTKSKQHFERSIKLAPEYLGTKVLMAEVYWTKEGRPKEFKKMLNEVLNYKLSKAPALIPENTKEKVKAQRLLDRIDELF